MIMCLMCQGWTPAQLRDQQRRHIEEFGWSIVAVEKSPAQAAFAYTVGLTRFHGHPELLVTGLDERSAAGVLNHLGEQVRAGRRFAAGDLDRHEAGQMFQFIAVHNPRRLVEAQAMYAGPAGLVPALQVVYSTATGRWPWQRGCPGGRRAQPLYGRPVHR
jgi:hypothetical protein